MRSLKDNSNTSFPFFTYNIFTCRSISRSATPNIYRSRDSSAGNSRHISSRSSSPIVFYTSGEPRPRPHSCNLAAGNALDAALNSQEIMNQLVNTEERMDFYPGDPSTLPQGDIPGRVQWIQKNNGRIRTIGKVQSTRDLFFHFNDVELEDGEQLEVGDRVLFRVSVYKQLVCATQIRKMKGGRSKSSVNLPVHREKSNYL